VVLPLVFPILISVGIILPFCFRVLLIGFAPLRIGFKQLFIASILLSFEGGGT